MDYSEYKKVTEVMGETNVNNLLKDGWEIISIAPGNDEDGAHFRYCLGWKDPIDLLGI